MKPIEWLGDKIRVIDQTRLPHEEVFLELGDYREVADAIRELRIRGAPDIGVAAAYGLALGAQTIETESKDEFLARLRPVSDTLSSSRPTAVNLFWALERMNHVAQSGEQLSQIKADLLAEAQRIEAENDEANRRLSELGAELIENGSTILTHCNAGSLATAAYGTALGVIKMANEQGKKVMVYATETRPLLQGARLTTWELLKENIPVTLVTDLMAGYFINRGEIDCVIVGADRIAANGDVANKIGTYTLAVLAMENAIPFYVAAPVSTIDFSLSSGVDIPIEERSPDEVTCIQGVRVAPEGVSVANPAFDVTPHNYVSAIITEKGVIREPYVERLRKLLETSSVAIPMATPNNRPHRSEDATEKRKNPGHAMSYKTWGKPRSLRLKGFNYASPGVSYHITIGANEKQNTFTKPSINRVVINTLRNSAQLYGYELIAYCLMPDHLHVLVQAGEDAKDLREFVRGFKSYCSVATPVATKRKLWQRGFYEHILREEESVADVAEYILNNPVRKGLVEEMDEYEWCQLCSASRPESRRYG